MIPTDEQAEIIAATRQGHSLMIRAYAGCAKTSSLVMAAAEVKNPALLVAFNKTTKEEAQKRLPKNFNVMTLNGLGFRALTMGHPNISFQAPDDRKLSKVLRQVIKDNRVELLTEQYDTLRALVNKAMLAGIVPGDMGRPLTPDIPESWVGLMAEMGIMQSDHSLYQTLAWRALARNNELVLQGHISFDDQVYYSTCVSGKFPQFPVTFVDEAQDLSPLNHQMLVLAARPGGRHVVVGDPKQAIYAFRGADSQSMDKLRMLRESWIDLPLTLTFRCPKVVVARQQEHAPGFRAHETNLDGRFARIAVWDDEKSQPAWTWDEVERLVGDKSLAILCRNNAPLLGMAFKLLRRRISVRVLGRDIGQGLISLSRKLMPDDSTDRDEMLGVVNDWQRAELDVLAANDEQSKMDSVRDRAESLLAVINYAEVSDAGRLRMAITDLFAKPDGRVTLSTIHKAKGLEWDAVLHLDPWRCPSKAALTRGGPDLEQERNLRYVCETRTRDVLMEASLEDLI